MSIRGMEAPKPKLIDDKAYKENNFHFFAPIFEFFARCDYIIVVMNKAITQRYGMCKTYCIWMKDC